MTYLIDIPEIKQSKFVSITHMIIPLSVISVFSLKYGNLDPGGIYLLIVIFSIMTMLMYTLDPIDYIWKWFLKRRMTQLFNKLRSESEIKANKQLMEELMNDGIAVMSPNGPPPEVEEKWANEMEQDMRRQEGPIDVIDYWQKEAILHYKQKIEFEKLKKEQLYYYPSDFESWYGKRVINKLVISSSFSLSFLISGLLHLVLNLIDSLQFEDIVLSLVMVISGLFSFLLFYLRLIILDKLDSRLFTFVELTHFKKKILVSKTDDDTKKKEFLQKIASIEKDILDEKWDNVSLNLGEVKSYYEKVILQEENKASNSSVVRNT